MEEKLLFIKRCITFGSTTDDLGYMITWLLTSEHSFYERIKDAISTKFFDKPYIVNESLKSMGFESVIK